MRTNLYISAISSAAVGNPNKPQNEQVDVCKLPQETGFGRALFSHFYYNSETNECNTFIYGGLGGNGNNFRTIAECQAACLKPVTAPKKPQNGLAGVCKKPLVHDGRKLPYKSYFYNMASNKCEEYTNGNLLGPNSFKSLAICQSTCSTMDNSVVGSNDYSVTTRIFSINSDHSAIKFGQ